MTDIIAQPLPCHPSSLLPILPQAALTSQRGADIIAFDDRSAMPVPGLADVGKVHDGNESELRK